MYPTRPTAPSRLLLKPVDAVSQLVECDKDQQDAELAIEIFSAVYASTCGVPITI